MTVAVNLATPGLQDPDIVAQFARMLDESGIAPDRLIVEVTESAMMADPGGPGAPWRASTRWAWASPSTTSAPAIPRWPT